jgi:hypothetical protein
VKPASVPAGGAVPSRALELLARDHALGERDELVARFPGGAPEAHLPDQPPAAPDLDREWLDPHRHSHGAVLQHERLGHVPLLAERRPPAV